MFYYIRSKNYDYDSIINLKSGDVPACPFFALCCANHLLVFFPLY